MRDLQPSSAPSNQVQSPRSKVQGRFIPALDFGPWTLDFTCLCIIVAGGLGLLLLIPPQHEYPIIDDWIYARSVQHQMATGAFQMPGQSQASLVGLTLWGTIW